MKEKEEKSLNGVSKRVDLGSTEQYTSNSVQVQDSVGLFSRVILSFLFAFCEIGECQTTCTVSVLAELSPWPLPTLSPCHDSRGGDLGITFLLLWR